MKPQLILEARMAKPDDLDRVTQARIEQRVRALYSGVTIKLKNLGSDASERAVGKSAQWQMNFAGGKMVVTLRLGAERHVLGEFDVGSVADARRRAQIIDALKGEKVIDDAEAAQFMRRHPDKDRLAELKAAIAVKLKAIEVLKDELLTLKSQLTAAGG